MTQKQEEICQLMAENKAYKIRLNERPEAYIVSELERKISEQESIIEVINNELETYKIQQDTSRMRDVFMKTSESFNKLNMTKSSLNRSHGTIKVPKSSNMSFVVKSHISREKMRRDKMLKELKEIQHQD